MNFEKIKYHEIFEGYRTDILKKIAHELENKEGREF